VLGNHGVAQRKDREEVGEGRRLLVAASTRQVEADLLVKEVDVGLHRRCEEKGEKKEERRGEER